MFNKQTVDMMEQWLKENKGKENLKYLFQGRFELTNEEAESTLKNLGYEEAKWTKFNSVKNRQ